MSRPGRPPKPTALKRLDGTLRSRDKAREEPSPELGIPPLPEGWASSAPWREEAAREYERIAPRLLRLGLLSEIDRAALLGYADAWGRWCHWTEEIAENGTVQVAQSGYESPRPAVAFRNKANEDMRRYLTMFGLSPADRARVTASTSPEESPYAHYFTTMKTVR